MGRVIPIFKKEFSTYFVSPIAYIVISIFLLVTGWLFFSTFFLFNQANLRNFFALLPITFAFVVPAVTMRLFSEELNIGSYEVLLTMPVTFRDVALGKFLASVAFLSAMLTLQDRVKKMGGNAVVNIRSYYKKHNFDSPDEFECGNGAVIAGVTLKGDVVTLK